MLYFLDPNNKDIVTNNVTRRTEHSAADIGNKHLDTSGKI